MESVARWLFQKVNTRRNTFQVRVSTLNKKLPKGCTCGKQTHITDTSRYPIQKVRSSPLSPQPRYQGPLLDVFGEDPGTSLAIKCVNRQSFNNHLAF